MAQPGDITQLLQAWAAGDEAARDAAIELAYPELRRIAQNRLRTEGDALTLDATGLAHEAYLRLAEQHQTRWENRAQFFAIVARVMRRILVDRHRARMAQKRAGGVARVAFSDVDLAMPEALDLDRLNDALDRLALQDARQAQIVELRFFAGLTIEEAGEAVGVSPATLKREWVLARAWLKRELDDAG
ncbi:MAG: ECF-type sigma factor [Kofleriaceae bacterium]